MDYTALRDDLVIPMIEKYGKAVSLRRPGVTTGWTKTWNAAEGRYQWTLIAAPYTVVYVDPAAVPVDYSGHAVEKEYEQTEIDGSTVLANDRLFLTIDIPIPTIADKFVVGSSILTIVSAIAIQPGAVTLVWKIQCRGI